MGWEVNGAPHGFRLSELGLVDARLSRAISKEARSPSWIRRVVTKYNRFEINRLARVKKLIKPELSKERHYTKDGT